MEKNDLRIVASITTTYQHIAMYIHGKSTVPSPIITNLFLDQIEYGGSRFKEYYEITTFVQTTGTSKWFLTLFIHILNLLLLSDLN